MKSLSLKEKYNKEAKEKLQEKLGFKNVLEAPKIEKVVINSGIGRFIKDSSHVDEVLDSLTAITGQRPIKTKARLSIAGFKIREGQEVGLKVTLRDGRMWDFLDRLIFTAIPRTRDFQGIKRSAIDQNGNLNLGIKEQTIFPEISPENVQNIFSFQISVQTSAKNKKEGEALFESLGFPLVQKK